MRDEIVFVNVSQSSRRPFWNLERLLPTRILEGPSDIEVIWAEGTPRERHSRYAAIPRREWANVQRGADYVLEDGIANYFEVPPSGIVWFDGCLFRKVKDKRVGIGR